MGWVYDPAKSDALIDRGVTLLLAALEVGPHIKPIRAATGLDHRTINDGSFRLRQHKIWVGKECRYSWLSAYRQGLPEGIAGLTTDATTAVGVDGSGEVWSTAREGRYNSRGKNWAADVPFECGTSVSLSRHRRNGEHCQPCEDAAEQRHLSWLERKARIKVQREEWLAERDKATNLQLKDWEGLLAPEKGSSVWATVSLDAPSLFAVDGEKTSLYDRVGRSYEKDFRDVHNLEWVDETYDAAEPELAQWLDGRRFIDLSFSEVREEADEMVAGFSQGRTFARSELPHRHKSRNRWS